MIAAVKAELLKHFTTRMWWIMAIILVVLSAAFAVLNAVIFDTDLAAGPAGQDMMAITDDTVRAKTVYTAGTGFGYILLLAIGVLHMGSEVRHRTVTSTFLAQPKRERVMAAKVIALLGIGAFYGALVVGSGVLAGSIVLSIQGHPLFPSLDVYRALALSLLVLGLWALIGLGVGILIPNQVAALIIGVSFAWIIEPLLGLALMANEFTRDYVAPYLPGQATGAIVSGFGQTPEFEPLRWWVAALVLAAWAAIPAGLGTLRVVRQDIT